ncbi:MAG TPA: transglycosylase SLT domain-containing protein [Xanthobacteraceae bacterium]|nr:transglycosylase SLT domain-containing protein [Xanthobacteraceae bacterium]
MRTTAMAVLCLLVLTSVPFADEQPPASSTFTPPAADGGNPVPSAGAAVEKSTPAPKEAAGDSESASDAADRDLSRAELCDALADSAQNNDVPVAFFTSLIWQESRFDTDSVSPAGAQGVAQFMPKVAQELGLKDPFDPRAALRASARLLRSLFEKFGNFGLAAAAYNAGPKRISDWLANRGKLPQETRHYVRIITGRPAEDWRSRKPESVSFKLPARMPCPRVGVFAELPLASIMPEPSRELKADREKTSADKTRKATDEKRVQTTSASSQRSKQAERKDDRAGSKKHARAYLLDRVPKAKPRPNGRKQLIARRAGIKLASLVEESGRGRSGASRKLRRS